MAVYHQEHRRPRGAWCGDLVDAVVAELSSGPPEFCGVTAPDIHVWIVWDDDGDPEMIISPTMMGAFAGRERTHARILLTMEDDGERSGFWSLGWQGCPGGHMDVLADEPSVRAVARFLREFFMSESAALARAMISGQTATEKR